jgi:hypothetical protein
MNPRKIPSVSQKKNGYLGTDDFLKKKKSLCWLVRQAPISFEKHTPTVFPLAVQEARH